MEKTILITGAAGYIGSHCVESLINSEAKSTASRTRFVFLDNLSTGHSEFIEVLKEYAVEKGFETPSFYQIDLLDQAALNDLFLKHRPTIVFHFAALISVAESVEKPELYFKNNVQGSKNLLNAMKAAGTNQIIFSSTASVYGMNQNESGSVLSLSESAPINPVNPYGESKLLIEKEIQAASRTWGLSAVIFRYFNAAGASHLGHLGEWHEPETHLIPLVLRAALNGTTLSVFGTDYPTRDGSCVRDYIHVLDLADAHLKASAQLTAQKIQGVQIFNLGTNRGYTVLEMIAVSERVTGTKIDYQVMPRRAGDSAVLVADSTKAENELGWRPMHSSLEELLQTAFAWEKSEKI